MPARRKRRPGSDRLYVTSSEGLPLGHLDLVTRESHDVPTAFRDHFAQEANSWLWHNNMPTMAGPDERPEPPALGAGADPPEHGWDPGVEDLALRPPGYGLSEEASAARARLGRDADRPYRLRADGRHEVSAALAKLTRRGTLRPGRTPRWRMLNAVPMAFEDHEIVLDHVVIGPPGAFVIEARNIPGGRVVVAPESLEIDDEKVDLGLRRRIGEEVAYCLSTGLARAAGAAETLNPPTVTPVVAVIGAVVIGGERPRGVLVSRVGQLPRLLQAFSPLLGDAGVTQTYEVARRSVTWTL